MSFRRQMKNTGNLSSPALQRVNIGGLNKTTMRQCNRIVSESILKHFADDCAKHGTSRERLVADAINDDLNALRKTHHAPPIQECIRKFLKNNCVR